MHNQSLSRYSTITAAYNLNFADILTALGFERPEELSESVFRDAWTLTLPAALSAMVSMVRVCAARVERTIRDQ